MTKEERKKLQEIRSTAAGFGTNLDQAEKDLVAQGFDPNGVAKLFASQRQLLNGMATTTVPAHLLKILAKCK